MTETPLEKKSTVQEIAARFDVDVEQFSNLETAQASTIDAPLAMELITAAAVRCTPHMERVLDIGCGAGNNTLRLLQSIKRPVECDLLDLSLPMLARAQERVQAENDGKVRLHHGDFRQLDLPKESYDVLLAAAVFHHLRDDQDWIEAFSKAYRLLRKGGSIWISDFISHEIPAIDSMMFARYGDYLHGLGGNEYRDKVFEYIDREDSPRPVTYQLEILRQVGFSSVEILHKNSCFAAFGAIK